MVPEVPRVLEVPKVLRLYKFANRATAVGFALGCVEHATLFVFQWRGIWSLSNYPLWRHAAHAAVDGSIAYVGFRRPDRLFIPLLAFLVEQVLINGVPAIPVWRNTHDVPWVVVVEIALLSCALVAATSGKREPDVV
jgi:hypothetical protein